MAEKLQKNFYCTTIESYNSLFIRTKVIIFQRKLSAESFLKVPGSLAKVYIGVYLDRAGNGEWKVVFPPL